MGLFSKKSTIRGENRIGDLSINRCNFGTVVPEIVGTIRSGVNVIDWRDQKSIEHKQKSGGKGGGGVTSVTYTYEVYVEMALCEGSNDIALGPVWCNNKKFDTYDGVKDVGSGTWYFKPNGGATSYMQSKHPDIAQQYPGLCYIGGYLSLGDSPTCPTYEYEVKGKLRNTGNGIDANPADYIMFLLKRVGILPTNANDSAIEGLAEYRKYCKAYDYLMSTPRDYEGEVQDLVNQILELTNAIMFWSNDKFKIVIKELRPYNGWYPTNYNAGKIDYVAYLTDKDFSKDGVSYKRKPSSELYNRFTVNFSNRANNYESEAVSYEDRASIGAWGLNEKSVDAKLFYTQDRAVKYAQTLAYYDKYGRNEYSFKLDWAYVNLEPGDIVLLTYDDLCLKDVPAMIKTIEEDEDGLLEVKAVQMPPIDAGTPEWVVTSNDYNLINRNVYPGKTEVLIKQLPVAMCGDTGVTLAIATKGGSNWGGCNIFTSLQEFENYNLETQTKNFSRFGKLIGSIAIDTDTLVTNCNGTFSTVTEDVQDAGETLIMVDDEVMSYRTVIIGENGTYILGGLKRGLKGTVAQPHSDNADLLRLDGNYVYADCDDTLIGKDIYFRLPAFNIYGLGLQEDYDTEVAFTHYRPTPILHDITNWSYEIVENRHDDGTITYNLVTKWDLPKDNVTSKVLVYMRDSDNNIWLSMGYFYNTYIVSNVSFDKTYDFKYLAVNDKNRVQSFDEARVYTVSDIEYTPAGASNLPENLRVQFRENDARVQWDFNGQATFEVRFDNAFGNTNTNSYIGRTQSNQMILSYEDYLPYSGAIYVAVMLGQKKYSAPVYISYEYPKPNAPANVYIDKNNGTIRWSKVSNIKLSAYKIYGEDSLWQTVDADVLEITGITLDAGNDVGVYVSAVNIYGVEGEKTKGSYTKPIPNTPTDLVIDYHKPLLLKWKQSSDTNAPVEYYDVYYYDKSINNKILYDRCYSNQISIDPGRVPASGTFYVVAISPWGDKSVEAVLNYSFPKPTEVQNITLIYGKACTVSWDYPDTAGIIDHYEIRTGATVLSSNIKYATIENRIDIPASELMGINLYIYGVTPLGEYSNGVRIPFVAPVPDKCTNARCVYFNYPSIEFTHTQPAIIDHFELWTDANREERMVDSTTLYSIPLTKAYNGRKLYLFACSLFDTISQAVEVEVVIPIPDVTEVNAHFEFKPNPTLVWDKVSNVQILRYEVYKGSRLAENPILLASTVDNKVELELDKGNRAGSVNLYAVSAYVDENGKDIYSDAVVVGYNKSKPGKPTQPEITKVMQGFIVKMADKTEDCVSYKLTIDDEVKEIITNNYQFYGSAKEYKVSYAYADYFGDGESSDIVNTDISAFIDPALIEKESLVADKLSKAVQDELAKVPYLNSQMVSLTGTSTENYSAIMQLENLITLQSSSWDNMSGNSVIAKINLGDGTVGINGKFVHITGDTLFDDNVQIKGDLLSGSVNIEGSGVRLDKEGLVVNTDNGTKIKFDKTGYHYVDADNNVIAGVGRIQHGQGYDASGQGVNITFDTPWDIVPKIVMIPTQFKTQVLSSDTNYNLCTKCFATNITNTGFVAHCYTSIDLGFTGELPFDEVTIQNNDKYNLSGNLADVGAYTVNAESNATEALSAVSSEQQFINNIEFNFNYRQLIKRFTYTYSRSYGFGDEGNAVELLLPKNLVDNANKKGYEIYADWLHKTYANPNQKEYNSVPNKVQVNLREGRQINANVIIMPANIMLGDAAEYTVSTNVSPRNETNLGKFILKDVPSGWSFNYDNSTYVDGKDKLGSFFRYEPAYANHKGYFVIVVESFSPLWENYLDGMYDVTYGDANNIPATLNRILTEFNITRNGMELSRVLSVSYNRCSDVFNNFMSSYCVYSKFTTDSGMSVDYESADTSNASITNSAPVIKNTQDYIIGYKYSTLYGQSRWSKELPIDSLAELQRTFTADAKASLDYVHGGSYGLESPYLAWSVQDSYAKKKIPFSERIVAEAIFNDGAIDHKLENQEIYLNSLGVGYANFVTDYLAISPTAEPYWSFKFNIPESTGLKKFSNEYSAKGFPIMRVPFDDVYGTLVQSNGQDGGTPTYTTCQFSFGTVSNGRYTELDILNSAGISTKTACLRVSQNLVRTATYFAGAMNDVTAKIAIRPEDSQLENEQETHISGGRFAYIVLDDIKEGE